MIEAMINHRPLIMRGNRALGLALLQAKLITSEAQEKASQRLLEYVQVGDFQNANLLNILIFEQKVLNEQHLMNYLLKEHHLGLIDLMNYKLPESLAASMDIDLCRATWTVPFDLVEDVSFVATTSYLSKPMMEFWESRLNTKILWFATTIRGILDGLERLQSAKPK
jgi:hypothetical protein